MAFCVHGVSDFSEAWSKVLASGYIEGIFDCMFFGIVGGTWPCQAVCYIFNADHESLGSEMEVLAVNVIARGRIR